MPDAPPRQIEVPNAPGMYLGLREGDALRVTSSAIEDGEISLATAEAGTTVLESETILWAQDLAGTGVTVNALLPGGATETGLIPPSVGPEARAAMLRPAIVVPPLLWLASDASAAFTGRRVDAKLWRSDLSLGEAAERASEVAGWAQRAEPRRVSRRLLILREWSHDEAHTPIFPRGPRACGPDGAGAPGRA